jgi:hypothetical protein
MPSKIDRIELSGSTNGLDIKVAQTATPGTLIHTAQAGTTTGQLDYIWLYARNEDTAARILTIEWGGVAVPDNVTTITLAPQAGDQIVKAGIPLRNTLVVRAFCDAANKVMINGFVDRVTA